MSVYVSAIITTHNRKELLPRAIESVLTQTYNDMECIVIDDASSDGTTEYIKDYILSGKIVYHRIPENETKGGNHARNVGISMSKGEYIAFLDDDDEWLPDKIRTLVAALDIFPEAHFVHSAGYKEYDNEAGRRELVQLVKNIETEVVLQDLSIDILTEIRTLNIALFVKKDILVDIGEYDENLRFLQEYEMSVRLFQKTKAIYVNKPLYVIHINTSDNQRLTNNIDGWEQALKAINLKHQNLIDKLSFTQKMERKFNFLRDGINRAKTRKAYAKIAKYYSMILFNPGIDMMLIKKTIRKVKTIFGKQEAI